MNKSYRILTVQNDPIVSIRLPKEALEAITALANANNRSFNTQAVISLVEQIEQAEKAAYGIAHKDMDSQALMQMIMGNKCVDFKPA